MLRWAPSPDEIERTNISRYIRWLASEKGLVFTGYQTLWEWSVANMEDFWSSLFQYFNIIHNGEIMAVTNGKAMPLTRWFEGIEVSYAEHVFRNETELRPAIIFTDESGAYAETSWAALKLEVASLQHFLKDKGVTSGDRVVGYLPCTPEATVAFLATNSLGAIWSSCSPDFGTPAVIDRFAQLEPKVLIAADTYRYGGKTFDKVQAVRELINALPSLEVIILISNNETLATTKAAVPWKTATQQKTKSLEFVRVPFNHPIWVLFSSGTTGIPKAIVHSQGGILLEQLKYGVFHNDYRSGERCFWYTTTGWMMWNYIHGSLLAGCTMVLYDGSPSYPDLNNLWQFIQDAGVNHFGTSAGYILANIKHGITPGRLFNLRTLRSIGSTGSTLPPEGFDWIYDAVKQDVWLTSMSGGTDVCSAFVGGNPTWPVYAGEIQCRALGVSVKAFNESGEAIAPGVGEMVVTKPLPSMPIFFWNDPDFQRYRESYFEMYPGIWRHGDWISITEHHGIIIYGRSDATLNRGGVRIGTSEVYRAVDTVAEVRDSLIVCLEKPGGEFWMPLFVVLQEGHALTTDLKHKLIKALRDAYSPRHVPDEIIEVTDIPYTISGKKTEMPVKKILMGKSPKEVANPGSLKNPESLDFFAALAAKRNP